MSGVRAEQHQSVERQHRHCSEHSPEGVAPESSGRKRGMLPDGRVHADPVGGRARNQLRVIDAEAVDGLRGAFHQTAQGAVVRVPGGDALVERRADNGGAGRRGQLQNFALVALPRGQDHSCSDV